MANTDIRTRTQTDKGKRQGLVTVRYRDAKGRTMNATVIAAGTSSGLKLQIRNAAGTSQTIVDNVAASTTNPQGTGTYDTRFK